MALLSIVGVVDIFGANVKPSAKRIHQCLYPFYLQVCWSSGSVIGYNADADSLAAAVPGSARYDGPLSLPFFGGQYLAVAGTKAVADNKVTVYILRTGQAIERS